MTRSQIDTLSFKCFLNDGVHVLRRSLNSSEVRPDRGQVLNRYIVEIPSDSSPCVILGTKQHASQLLLSVVRLLNFGYVFMCYHQPQHSVGCESGFMRT